MSQVKKEPQIPRELIVFAQATKGDYETRHTAVVNHAFYEYGVLLNPYQLRELCGGGSQATAQRVLNAFREGLHRTFVQRCSVEAVEEWLNQGMSSDMTTLSPKERQFAKVFQAYVARLTLPH
ncbi:hypothetical protein RQP54_17840 [Curvibacter sp. APW13]|uniref:hypothetical protein n=1 Tax=Curvibacter sp. APW13 TaxID=3077236 RepID=UPI0028DF6E50|nr:hypothetical protein [Curvibacter sp. APW13]MDT8992739.1 hypothetical protein [Curvibacter sp. APW13]